MNKLIPVPATTSWLQTLQAVRAHGDFVKPRGLPTFELAQHTMAVGMLQPVVAAPSRNVSAKFLGGEAFWILSGDNTVEGIAPYNKNIAKFSDDGESFYGAYGPRIASQIDYVVAKLVEDPDTRQAGLTIWHENPPQTKDVPCTVSMFFSLRDGALNSHVFMRSSDVWLGVPYDVFNFTMVAFQVACRLKQRGPVVRPGTLYLTAASRHLYHSNLDAADEVLARAAFEDVATGIVPSRLWQDEATLMTTLDAIRQGDRAARWWEQ